MQVEGALWTFLVNKRVHIVFLAIALSMSLRPNIHADCISSLIKKLQSQFFKYFEIRLLRSGFVGLIDHQSLGPY